jgi:ankyrin repeat protein
VDKQTFPPTIIRALAEIDVETLERWLTKNDIDWQDGMGYTLLMHACQNKTYDSGRWLVEQGADITLKMKRGYDALNLTYFAGEIAMGAYPKETLDFAALLKARLKEG